MNIFCYKSGHYTIVVIIARFSSFPPIFCCISDEFSEFCSTFGTLHYENSSNTAKILEKMKKNSFNYIPIRLLNGHFWNQKCWRCLSQYDITEKSAICVIKLFPSKAKIEIIFFWRIRLYLKA